MTNPIAQETNLETGKTLERDLTAEEIATREAIFTQASQAIADSLGKVSQKAALLEKLGITEDEAKLLLA